MRKVLIAVFLTGLLCSLIATDSRILTMGRTDDFFMDDYSVFRNPANISIYPNMLMGSLGIYKEDPELDDTSSLAGLSSHNRDPQKPFFGGILSYSLNQSADAGDQYPMLSLGVVLNRYDEALNFLLPESEQFFGHSRGTDLNLSRPNYEAPVGKVDVLLGIALKNGAMIGCGGYMAFQKMKVDGDAREEMKLFKGSLGVNWPIAKTMDLEVSLNGGIMTQIGRVDSVSGVINHIKYDTVCHNDIFVKADIRLFSALSTLNGDFVPHLGFDYMQFNQGDEAYIDFEAGIGMNLNIDRGFFWTGLELFYQENSNKYFATEKVYQKKYRAQERYGARISFGIERNIIWDWFVWRVGATKMLAFEKVGGANGQSKWIENPEADAGDEDHVAFGLGLNIENRLKVDVVFAEDVFYTWSNLISGNHHHLTNRITVTYSF